MTDLLDIKRFEGKVQESIKRKGMWTTKRVRFIDDLVEIHETMEELATAVEYLVYTLKQKLDKEGR